MCAHLKTPFSLHLKAPFCDVALLWCVFWMSDRCCIVFYAHPPKRAFVSARILKRPFYARASLKRPFYARASLKRLFCDARTSNGAFLDVA
jgi:hypothetical protein